MTKLLLITLLFIIFIYIFLLKKSLISPTVAYTLPFVFSSAIMIFNNIVWKIDISQETYLIVIASVLFLSFGELYASFIYRKKETTNNYIKILKPNVKFTYLFIIFITITLYFYINFVFKIGSANLSNSVTLLAAFRGAEKSMSLALKMSIGISRTLAYYYLYSFIQNYVFLNTKKIIYFIPVLIYIIISISSSSRIEFLYFYVFSVVIYYTFLKIKFNWIKIINIKRLTNILISIMIILLSFYMLGFLTGKSLDYNAFEIITIYAGSSIPALDNYINNFNYDFSNFGSETLFNEKNFLNIIFNIKDSQNQFLEFTNIGESLYRTNIYTNIRRLLNDYNYFGLFFIQFLTGFIYSIIYLKMKKEKHNNNLTFIYSYFLIYLIFSVIDERVISLIPTYTSFFTIMLFIFLLRFKVITNYEILKIN